MTYSKSIETDNIKVTINIGMKGDSKYYKAFKELSNGIDYDIERFLERLEQKDGEE